MKNGEILALAKLALQYSGASTIKTAAVYTKENILAILIYLNASILRFILNGKITIVAKARLYGTVNFHE